jgi:hypothetical protein
MTKAPTTTSKKPKRIPNPPRRCIFCGGSPISRDHIWAQWMRPEVEQAQVLEKTYAETRASPKQRRHVKTTGDARSRKLKIVCIPCNSGWMSRLQELTKPILSPPLVLR